MDQLKVYDNPKQFWREVSPHLKKEESKNSLCLGLSYTFQSKPSDCMYQSALFRDNQLLGALVVSRYRTQCNLLPTSTTDRQTAEQLFNVFQKKNISLTGVVGEKEIANTYKKLISDQGLSVQILMVQGIYKCTAIKMPNVRDTLSFRIASPNDIQVIGRWIEDFHAEAVPHDPPIKGSDYAKNKIESKMIYLLEDSGKPVSMAGWSRDFESSCSVNYVFTPKLERKNGYASIVTAQLTQLLLDSGKRETNLYTDMTNPTSNKIYKDIGYKFVCDSVHYGISNK